MSNVVSPGTAHKRADPLAEARHLLFLGKLPATILLVRSLLAAPAVATQAQLLLVRCFMLQGRYQQAQLACEELMEAVTTEGKVLREIHLRHGFLQIYRNGDPAPAIAAGRSTLQWSLKRTGIPDLLALSQVLLGKALALASEWGLLPADAMVEARSLLTEAAHVYRDAGILDESLSALLSLGQLYTMGSQSDRSKARSMFQRVYDQAREEENGVRMADAALRLAELDFESGNEGKSEEAPRLDLSSYQKALELYAQADCALGPADVWLSLGNPLVERGFDGTAALQQAISLYRQEDNLTGVYSAQRTLSTWYVQQGNLDQARDYHQQSAEIAQETGFPLGQATAYLGLGDYYFRAGDYARALAYCERAGNLAMQPAISAMVGLSLANIYTSMHMYDRAESACHSVIGALSPAGPSNRLSLARFILGNALSSRGDWVGAIAAWREGLAEDEVRQDVVSQAEKLQCLAQATVMQYYSPAGPPVPESTYVEALSLFGRSIAVLQGREDPQARALIANTYQLQGQVALTCEHLPEALHSLAQAADTYTALKMGMQAAVSNTLVGMLCYELGNRGSTDLYAEAVPHYEQALDYFERAQMRDMSWKIRFHLALVSFHRGRLTLTAGEQQTHWRDAANRLEEASDDIEFVRARFVATNQLTAQDARLGIVSDKEKVYIIAIRLYYRYLHDKASAFRWLERLKGRTFLDALALSALRPPALADESLLPTEHQLLEALHTATAQTALVALNEQLRAVWDQMAADTAAAEYVALRRGRTADWDDVIALLRPGEDDQK